LVVLVGASFLAYLDTLPVNNADLFLLSTRHPSLVSRAINDILRGSALRFVMASTVLALALGVGWVVLASVGRGAIVNALLDYFKARYEELELSGVPESGVRTGRLRPMVALNGLRAIVSLAAVVGCIGAFLLGSLVSPDKTPQPFLAFLVVTACLALVWLFWSTLNWYLSLASIFVVCDGADALEALSLAVGEFRDRPGSFFAVGFWFGIAHITAFFIATSAAGFPLGFAGVLPFGVVFGGLLIVTLLYFAVADWLYAGRLAAYVAIIEAPPSVPEVSVVAPPPIMQSPIVSGSESGPLLLESAPSAEMNQPPAMALLYPPIPPSEDDILSDVPGLIPPDENKTE
jgi:hypothetical protein